MEENMKKALILLLLAICLVAAMSCTKASDKVAEKHSLIVFFSHSGNTKAVAEHMNTIISHSEMFEIVVAEPYSQDMDAVLARGRNEFENNLRPELQQTFDDIAKYDVIYIGYPIWFSSVPMAVLTFLETHDMTGKTIVPFSTRGGGEIGESVDRIRAATPDSKVLDGFHDINRANYGQATELTDIWFADFDIKK